MKLYLGCSQWGWESWKGGLYPQNIKPSDYLSNYSRIFNAVELNPTFYDEVSSKTIVRWKSMVTSDFRFCPKFPGSISHDRVLRNVASLTSRFVKSVKQFDENLGIGFLQLPLKFSHSELHLLDEFLKSLPRDFQISVELREPFLRNAEHVKIAMDIIENNSAGIVLTDGVETRKYLNSLRLTNNSAFIRFLSYNHPTDLKRIDDWIKLIERWREKGLREVYFFLHFPDEFQKPDIVVYSLNKFGRRFGLKTRTDINKLP